MFAPTPPGINVYGRAHGYIVDLAVAVGIVHHSAYQLCEYSAGAWGGEHGDIYSITPCPIWSGVANISRDNHTRMLAVLHNCKREETHMRTVTVSINKGGVGKTMTVKTLAVAASAAKLTTLILDMDTQQNATNWGRRRKKQKKPLLYVRFITEQDLPDLLGRASKGGCDLTVIDTPPGRSSEAMAAVEVADLVIIPFGNDQDSYDGVIKTAALTRRLGKKAFGLLNFATPHSKIHAEAAREVLKAIGLPMVPVVLHRYDVHRLANINGLVAQEMEPESNAAREIATLWGWLSATLHIGAT